MVEVFWFSLALPGIEKVIWIHFFWTHWKGKVVKRRIIRVTSSTGTTHLISPKSDKLVVKIS